MGVEQVIFQTGMIRDTARRTAKKDQKGQVMMETVKDRSIVNSAVRIARDRELPVSTR